MKHIKKYESNYVCDKDTTELFKELKYHDEKHREIDKKLAKMCIEKLQPYLTSDLSDFEIKNIFYKFYKNCYTNDIDDRSDTVDFSFEKDMVLMWLNKELKIRSESKKYNI